MNNSTRALAVNIIRVIVGLVIIQSISHVAHDAATLEVQRAVEGEGIFALLSWVRAVLTSGWLFSIAVDLGVIVLFMVNPYYPDNRWLQSALSLLVSISGYSNLNNAVTGEIRYGGEFEWGNDPLLSTWRAVKVFLFSVPLTALPVLLVEVLKHMQEDEHYAEEAEEGKEEAPPKSVPAAAPAPTLPARVNERAPTPAPTVNPRSQGGLFPLPLLEDVPPLDDLDIGQGIEAFTPAVMPSQFGTGLPYRRTATPSSTGTGKASEGQVGKVKPLPVKEAAYTEGQGSVQVKDFSFLDDMDLTETQRRAVQLKLQGYTLDRIGQAQRTSKQAVSGLITAAKTKNPQLAAYLEAAKAAKDE